jgi:predicted RNA-binding Zn-ribbon protein involved in translation (DUF1610 family)
MKEKRIVTEIHTNIINHLFISFPCPKCQKRHPLSLRMIYTGQKFVCPDCGSRMQAILGGHNQILIDFVKSSEALHAQLRKIGLPLAFFHDLTETIWKRDDKP